MIKVASLVLDIYDDERCEIARDLPSDYHQIKVADHDEIAALPDRCFALVMKTASGELRRRFPIHTEDALKLSEAYFERTKDQLPREAVIMAMAKFAAAKDGAAYNDVAYVDLTKIAEARPAEPFPERFYGLALGNANHYPLHDEVLVKRAMARFPFTTEGMAPEHQFLYARNIEKRAGQLGVEVPADSRIHLYTNPALNLEALKEAIDQRKHAAAGSTSVEVLDQLAQAAGCRLDQGELEHPDSFALRNAKIAKVWKLEPAQIIATLQQFDKTAGYGAYEYARGMLDPFAACYKRASFAGSNSMLVDGVDYVGFTGSTATGSVVAEWFDGRAAVLGLFFGARC